MTVISENSVVFAEVERMLHALHDGDSAFDDKVVVLGYNVAKYLPQALRRKYPGKKVVAYQLEQLFPGSRWVNPHTEKWLRNVDEIWEYDLSNMDYLNRTGFKNILYRPMAYCEALRDIPVLRVSHPQKDGDSRWPDGAYVDKVLPRVGNRGHRG